MIRDGALKKGLEDTQYLFKADVQDHDAKRLLRMYEGMTEAEVLRKSFG